MSKLTIEDLLHTESKVLDRIARELVDQEPRMMARGHNSRTSGHRSSGSHNSHSSAMKENLSTKLESKQTKPC